MDLSDAQLKDAAARIRLGRSDLAAIFDSFVAKESPPGLSFMVVNAIRDKAHSAEFAALKAARDRGFGAEIIERIGIAEGFKDSTKGFRTTLQTAVSPELGYFAVGLAQPALLRAGRRVCRIIVDADTEVFGTGFLIGVRTVITSYHVIAPLLDSEGKPLENSHERLTIEFGKLGTSSGDEVAIAKKWLVASSAPHPDEEPTEAALDFAKSGDGDYANHLDFAVIRLAQPAGLERGFYRLDASHFPKIGKLGAQVTLFQHPGGSKMMMSQGYASALWPDAIKTRMHHTANSASGSSGGLLLDKEFKPIALHQCGIEQNGTLINGAIPTCCIAAKEQIVAEASGPDFIWKLPDGKPIVGRDALQSSIIDLIAGDRRLLAISGPSGSGRSFSLDIIKALTADGAHMLYILKAAQVSADASTFAGDLIERVHPDGVNARSRLPSPQDADTALDAWIRDTLAPAFIDLLKESAGNRTLWLAIDELDVNPLANTSVRQLLEKCYADAGANSFLRFVLAGLTGLVPAADPAWVSYVQLGEIHDADIEQYLNRAFTAKDCNAGPDEIVRLRKVVINGARLAGENWNASVSGFLQSVVDEAI